MMHSLFTQFIYIPIISLVKSLLTDHTRKIDFCGDCKRTQK
uniref:Uncharacterized protein n=1 Tax=Arundo donax TaxID=35708 RepID=A0A0A9BFY3_ARUDO